eukprot:CAMPEP_0114226038 /NCGR_PEP_ID=MMETSP0058-20121206/1017_1 /TAXON_ID=36894 /ORGANISM="Pyramimonas parkeae, CCMP726" /LENGTH=96 /DNA_ID=CAMNT_0001336733 /DNA_START=495 /DNA_END=781 /DNA_ORIENTATION=+
MNSPHMDLAAALQAVQNAVHEANARELEAKRQADHWKSKYEHQCAVIGKLKDKLKRASSLSVSNGSHAPTTPETSPLALRAAPAATTANGLPPPIP